MEKVSLSPLQIEKNLSRAKLLEWRLNPKNELHDPENQKLREPGNFEQRFNLRKEIYELKGKSKKDATQLAITDERKYINTLEKKFHHYYHQETLTKGQIFLNKEEYRLNTKLDKISIISLSIWAEGKRLSALSESKDIKKPLLIRNPDGKLDLLLNRSKNLEKLSEKYISQAELLDREIPRNIPQKPNHECNHNCKNHQPPKILDLASPKP